MKTPMQCFFCVSSPRQELAEKEKPNGNVWRKQAGKRALRVHTADDQSIPLAISATRMKRVLMSPLGLAVLSSDEFWRSNRGVIAR